ncbi:hypothetical protein P5673_017379 [Acropora cervicornis]|uniref:Uncharacterized protein n=1 Tax=Acropora cervicornis TaxID=6130 RepID=A0AAD9QEG8_ACRCE|nr:hypothetical protein P5673_017379 [Acropora cervicornis]
MFPARDRTFKSISDVTSTTVIERLRELKAFDIFQHPLPKAKDDNGVGTVKVFLCHSEPEFGENGKGAPEIVKLQHCPGELSVSADRLNSQLSPSFTQQNFAEFSSESRVHTSVYERVNCVGEVEEERAEELYVSRHLANEIRKSPENNNDPKRNPADHKSKYNDEEGLTEFDFMCTEFVPSTKLSSNYHSGAGASLKLKRRGGRSIVLPDHLGDFCVAEYRCRHRC